MMLEPLNLTESAPHRRGWFVVAQELDANQKDGGQRKTQQQPSKLTVVVVVGTALLTISVWVFFDPLKPIFGNIGLVGVFPIIVYGAGGYLTKADFNAMPWDVLVRCPSRPRSCFELTCMLTDRGVPWVSSALVFLSHASSTESVATVRVRVKIMGSIVIRTD
jgi:hypothetical protein